MRRAWKARIVVPGGAEIDTSCPECGHPGHDHSLDLPASVRRKAGILVCGAAGCGCVYVHRSSELPFFRVIPPRLKGDL